MTNEELEAENQRLRDRIASLQQELAAAHQTIRRAKDATPVARPSIKRVDQLVQSACMNLVRTTGGWVLTMGNLERKFRQLKEIWELLIADDWTLTDVFNPPPKQRRRNARPQLPGYQYRHLSIGSLLATGLRSIGQAVTTVASFTIPTPSRTPVLAPIPVRDDIPFGDSS